MGGGRRYDKQGSAYPIRINSEAIHSKDRGRGVKGKERRGKGGGRAAITLNWQVWLQHIKYNCVYRVGVKGDGIQALTPLTLHPFAIWNFSSLQTNASHGQL